MLQIAGGLDKKQSQIQVKHTAGSWLYLGD